MVKFIDLYQLVCYERVYTFSKHGLINFLCKNTYSTYWWIFLARRTRRTSNPVHTEAHKRLLLKKLPNVLRLHLKRFRLVNKGCTIVLKVHWYNIQKSVRETYEIRYNQGCSWYDIQSKQFIVLIHIVIMIVGGQAGTTEKRSLHRWPSMIS